MTDLELRALYHTLNLEPGTSLAQLKAMYLHMKTLYSSDSPLFHCLGFPIPETHKKEILTQIHRAYFTLREYHSRRRQERQNNTFSTVQDQRIPEFEHYNGQALQLTREVLGLTQEEVAFACGIPVQHLKSMESERFNQLPPRGYVRLFLRKYAQFMCLNPDRVMKDYMTLYSGWEKDSGSSGKSSV